MDEKSRKKIMEKGAVETVDTPVGTLVQVSMKEGEQWSLSELLSAEAGVEMEIPEVLSFLEDKVGVEFYRISFYEREDSEVLHEFKISSRDVECRLCPQLAFEGVTVEGSVSEGFFSVLLTAHTSIGEGVHRFDMDIRLALSELPAWSLILAPAAPGASFPGIGTLAALLLGVEDYAGRVKVMPWDASILDMGITAVAVEYDTENRELTCVRIQSQLNVGILCIGVQVSVPDMTLSGGISNPEPVKVAALLESLSLKNSGVPADLEIITGGFYASVSEETYDLHLAIGGVWGFGKGDTKAVYLEQIGAQIAYKQGTVSGELRGKICFAECLKVEMSAGYHSGKGWLFTGKAEMEEVVSMKVVTNYLKETLGMTGGDEQFGNIMLQELSVSYETGTGELTFLCGVQVEHIGTMTLELHQKKDRLVLGTYEAPGEGKIPVQALLRPISQKFASLLPEHMQISVKRAQVLGFWEGEEGGKLLLSLDTGMVITLEKIPFLGELLSDIQLGAKDIVIGYSFSGFTKEQIEKLGALSSHVPALPEEGLGSGFYAAGTFLKNGKEEPLLLQERGDSKAGDLGDGSPVPGSGGSLPEPSEPKAPAAESVPEKKWFDIQKKLGILYLARIGIGLQNPCIMVSVDASVEAGGLVFAVKDMGLSVQIDSGDVKGFLSGLSVEYSSSGFEIGGSLERVPPSGDTILQFDGSIVIRAWEWQFLALASFAQLKDRSTSFFAFLQVNGMIGGVPAFMVTGLMGGIGIHRKLHLPQVREVHEFPLLNLSGTKKNKAEILSVLEGRSPGENGKKREWLSVSKGNFWLAAGLQFNSCQLMEGKLLLVVELQPEVSFALLGLATLILPKGQKKEDAYVYIELQMLAVLNPSQGIFLVQAALTPNSFLLYKDCRLHGEFAFALWFGSNPHAGEFVVTIGGYHPAFRIPDYYPKAERVGFSWQISNTVTAKGDAYLAVTPSCVMAGGSLEILFQSGNLKAWFTAYAHFLLAWKPFYFTAEMGVEVGASYRIKIWFIQATIKVSVGATLKLWGPPVGGTARIHLSILSFSVDFGRGKDQGKSQAPLSWGEVKELLPKKEELCTIQAAGGVFEEREKEGRKVWAVSGGAFAFSVRSAIPSEEGRNISIRPMNCKENVTSRLLVNVEQRTETGYLPTNTSLWERDIHRQTVPGSLWGQPIVVNGQFAQRDTKPTAEVVPDCCMGFDVRLREARRQGEVSCITKEQPRVKARNPMSGGAVCEEEWYRESKETIREMAHAADPSVENRRKKLTEELKGINPFIGESSFKILVREREDLFTDQPMEVRR